MRFLFYLLLLSLVLGPMHGEELLFEGVWKEVLKTRTDSGNDAYLFLPFNPVIVMVGGYRSGKVKKLAKMYPKGQIFVFESNPEAFPALLKEVAFFGNVFVSNALLYLGSGTFPFYLYRDIYGEPFGSDLECSLLEPSEPLSPFLKKITNVYCLSFTNWCQSQKLFHIDYIDLDLGGCEWDLLQNISEILGSVSVIHIRTHETSFKRDTILFPDVKKGMEGLGFNLLSHWFCELGQGEATFIQRKIFDAMFK